jgi:hypothetical protein
MTFPLTIKLVVGATTSAPAAAAAAAANRAYPEYCPLLPTVGFCLITGTILAPEVLIFLHLKQFFLLEKFLQSH